VFVVKQRQVDAFRAASLADFSEELVAHLRGFAPAHAAMLGVPALRRAVGLGLARAAEHGLVTRGAARLFVELTFMLGSAFDTDPILPWAAGALRAPGGSQARADRLYSGLGEYLGRAVGARREHLYRAAARLEGLAIGPILGASQPLEDATLGALEAVYPEKCSFAGEAALRALVQEAVALARAHGVEDRLGASTFAAMGFAFGHRFADDPLLPWAARILREAPAPRRAAALRTMLRIHARRLLRDRPFREEA
jgi:hypothetical protein